MWQDRKARDVRSVATQPRSGPHMGTRAQRSRRILMTMTQERSPLALAWGHKQGRGREQVGRRGMRRNSSSNQRGEPRDMRLHTLHHMKKKKEKGKKIKRRKKITDYGKINSFATTERFCWINFEKSSNLWLHRRRESTARSSEVLLLEEHLCLPEGEKKTCARLRFQDTVNKAALTPKKRKGSK